MKKAFIFISLISVTLLAGCTPDSSREEYTRQIFAMDTIMSVTAYGTESESAADAAVTEIYRLEDLLSATDPDSQISQINSAAGYGTEVSGEVSALLQNAVSISEKTGGAFDISIAPVLTLWGFTTGKYSVPGRDALARALDLVGYESIKMNGNTITLSQGMSIDLGGIAKGYTGDCVMEAMTEYGVESALINLGGNVQTLGTKPDGSMWKIAIQDPESDGTIGTLSVSDAAVITSGGYQRYFEENGTKYHHIINPKTGYPADSGLLSVTIVSDKGITGDGLSTALFVMGTSDAIAFWQEYGDFEAVLITKDDIYITSGLENAFTLSDQYKDRSVVVVTAD